ncbi:unnamed protein product [Cylindrotheca closterium]|uniref:HhH-GPD domain-containing protein n=1 Tax=Cylindrotheca closterium TaxID=2856 RepID=A0AAD2CCR4_9STRA|nr:unnamed protein product [Cylindrotheca closterium]
METLSSGVLESKTKGQQLEEEKIVVEFKTIEKSSNNSASQVIVIDDDSSENEPINNNIQENKQEAGAKRSNPFALFAFQSTEPLPPKKKLDTSPTTSRFQKWNSEAHKTNNKKPKTERAKPKCVPPPKMEDVSVEERERIQKKWHSLVDPEASLEVKRFQMLVAARLHARCQQASVEKAMTKLRESFPNFTVDAFADVDPELLVPCINNVVHYNVKAQQIVKAAQEVRTNFNGVVPEDEKSLLKLTGIGNVFADLLAFVNTRAAYEKPADK